MYSNENDIIDILKTHVSIDKQENINGDVDRIYDNTTYIDGSTSLPENIIPGRTYYAYLLTVRGNEESLEKQLFDVPDNTDPIISDVHLEADRMDNTKLTFKWTMYKIYTLRNNS